MPHQFNFLPSSSASGPFGSCDWSRDHESRNDNSRIEVRSASPRFCDTADTLLRYFPRHDPAYTTALYYGNCSTSSMCFNSWGSGPLKLADTESEPDRWVRNCGDRQDYSPLGVGNLRAVRSSLANKEPYSKHHYAIPKYFSIQLLATSYLSALDVGEVPHAQ